MVLRLFANFIVALIILSWTVGVAILSVQNATRVSLRFLNYQSIEIPVGVVLAFCFGLGMVGVAIAQPFWRSQEPHSDEFDIDL